MNFRTVIPSWLQSQPDLAVLKHQEDQELRPIPTQAVPALTKCNPTEPGCSRLSEVLAKGSIVSPQHAKVTTQDEDPRTPISSSWIWVGGTAIKSVPG